MGLDPVLTFKRLEVPKVHESISTARHQRIARELQLSDQLGMSLKRGKTGSCEGGPESASRVQRSCDDVLLIEGDRINLLEMTLQHQKTLARHQVPDTGRAIVRS